jgi:hypothetical protein
MNIEARLAEILTALDNAGAVYLVMGGHAARYYGVERNTADYDLHLSLGQWGRLDELLLCVHPHASVEVCEGPTWRRGDFRRFLIGRLPDGREEWLEFWRKNHLLPQFDQLYNRREMGLYGNRQVPFLSISDLIRSKETERESDWQDVAILEEIRDARNFALSSDRADEIEALSQLRSRKGLEFALHQSMPTHRDEIAAAYARSDSPITRAFLTPLLPHESLSTTDAGMIGEILRGPLGKVEPASAKHLALVEAVRRLYKKAAMERDRADKMKALYERESK